MGCSLDPKRITYRRASDPEGTRGHCSPIKRIKFCHLKFPIPLPREPCHRIPFGRKYLPRFEYRSLLMTPKAFPNCDQVALEERSTFETRGTGDNFQGLVRESRRTGVPLAQLSGLVDGFVSPG